VTEQKRSDWARHQEVQGPQPERSRESDEVLLEVQQLEKAFGATQALRGVSMSVRAGEIHGLVGPNGAGKSTLIKILTGIHVADAGKVLVSRVGGSGKGRIGVVHQDLGLVDMLTIRENLRLSRGSAPTRFGFVRTREERSSAARELHAVELDLDTDTAVGDLGIGEKALVAVARVLAHDADILILDEVTAALTRKESTYVLAAMRTVANHGRGVIIVSHRLNEIVESCDAVTVIRDGRVAHAGSTPTVGELHDLLSGQRESSVPKNLAKARTRASRPVLSLRQAVGAGVGPLDLELYAGEVVAVIGSLASGLYGVGHLVAGVSPLESGERIFTDASSSGSISLVAEDRHRQGLLVGLSVDVNMSISAWRKFTRATWIRRDLEHSAVAHEMGELDVRPNDPKLKIETLSGGNQQKVLLGRASMNGSEILVLCEPTRGVDVATRQAIYDFASRVKQSGGTVLVITIDFDDALAMADRILIMQDGAITDSVAREAADATELIRRVG
jgi:ribose transport system ATP-binding protein